MRDDRPQRLVRQASFQQVSAVGQEFKDQEVSLLSLKLVFRENPLARAEPASVADPECRRRGRSTQTERWPVTDRSFHAITNCSNAGWCFLMNWTWFSSCDPFRMPGEPVYGADDGESDVSRSSCPLP